MLVRPIEFGSAEYAAFCELRRRFLREPLGLELTAHDVEGEDRQHLFGLFREAPGDAASLVGGLAARPEPRGVIDPAGQAVRLRQVVVHDEWRSRGHGSLMLREAERLLAERGVTEATLWARGEAVEFYLRNGYRGTGERQTLIGLEHERLEKPLAGG